MTSSCNGEERFAAALEALGGNRTCAQEMHADLTTRYAEPQRVYHTMGHIHSCLSWLDLYRGHAERPAEVELALWFHDAIYDPRRADNEHRSAELTAQCLERAGASALTLSRVVELILSTARHEPAGTDQALLTSIDLAILGADPTDFDSFERAIRSEYAHVPEPAYVQGRSAVLAGFLVRPVIYASRPIGELLESRARKNLERALSQLSNAAKRV